MKVWIDRDICQADLPQCLTCLSHLVRHGSPEHVCIPDYDLNGKRDLTIFTCGEGQNRDPLVIPKLLVDMVVHEFRDGVLAPKIEIHF